MERNKKYKFSQQTDYEILASDGETNIQVEINLMEMKHELKYYIDKYIDYTNVDL